jgi:hypothetical protein
MKRILFMVTVALMLALMVALSGAALAAEGSGGHVEVEDAPGITYSGGEGGSATGSGGGGHFSGDLFNLGVFLSNEGSGGGGSATGEGGGGGGCITFFGERTCSGSGGGGTF